LVVDDFLSFRWHEGRVQISHPNPTADLVGVWRGSLTVSSHNSGRHRAPSNLSSASSFSSAFSRSAKPASKASAVIVISGAMVASLALPASAAAPIVKATAPVALAVAVAAPSSAQAPLAPRTFGNIGFAGVVKPKPVVAPVVQQAVVVSRSTTRSAISPTSTPAPVAAASRSGGIAPVAAASRSGGILGIAASLAGIYYIYGGTTTAGFDCSGYTQYVFAKMGISIPRTSEAQQAAVTPVSNPQPGDLVFFGSPAGHVGIYAGNGMMWDSPHTGVSIGLHKIWSSSATYGRP
jgi:peptidoglycan DL-endopeptidase CwlO